MKKKSSVRIGIVASSFRKEVSDALLTHCLKTFRKEGVLERDIRIVYVPGAFEIPLALKKLAKTNRYDALIAFGAVVKGETYHFEQISNECARASMNIALEYEIPVVFEVLAVFKLKDALERATRARENKGVEAAETALSMIHLLKNI